jgi:hypothetical protein
MREAAMFFNDFLIEEPEHGWLVVSPSKFSGKYTWWQREESNNYGRFYD